MNNEKVNSGAGIAIFGSGLSINTAPQSSKTVFAKPKTPLIAETALEEQIEPFSSMSLLRTKGNSQKSIQLSGSLSGHYCTHGDNLTMKIDRSAV